jgi:hypothetical protein
MNFVIIMFEFNGNNLVHYKIAVFAYNREMQLNLYF